MNQVVPGQAEDTQAALKRRDLPGTVMLKVVSSINRSVQYTEGLEYSRAAQGRGFVPCTLLGKGSLGSWNNEPEAGEPGRATRGNWKKGREETEVGPTKDSEYQGKQIV